MDNPLQPGPYARLPHQHQHHHVTSHSSSHDSPSTSSSTSLQPLIPLPPPSSSGYYSANPPPPRIQTVAAARSPVQYASAHDYSYRSYGHPGGSPNSTTGGSGQDGMGGHPDAYGGSGISPGHLSGGSLSQKRAYRQRRKDPSCDACRERKVKCDATETTSCSECLSRNVKCQFTKETNRRMSSIKQVQDLQNQLADAKQQINQLQSIVHTTPSSTSGQPDKRISSEPTPLHVASSAPAADAQSGSSTLAEMEHVRKAVRTFGRGVFKPPPVQIELLPNPVISTNEITLPPKAIADQLIGQYYSQFQRQIPMIHWPSFSSEVAQLYEKGSFLGFAQIWASQFFGVLACGTLQSPDPKKEGCNPDNDGMRYMMLCAKLLNTWTEDLKVGHARGPLLISLYLTEQNVKSSGWIYCGSAARCAIDMGMSLEGGPYEALCLETRKRVLWTIFATDRFHSLEGRPCSLDEDEFIGNMTLPNFAAEDWLQPVPADLPPPPSPFPPIATISVIRLVSEIKKTLKSHVLTPVILKTYDGYFKAITNSYPDIYLPTGEGYVHPSVLGNLSHLLIAKFILFRQNLHISAQRHERLDAQTRLAAVAQETASYITRAMQTPPNSPSTSVRSADEGDVEMKESQQPSYRTLFRLHASTSLSRHIWRCTLILLLRGEYADALTCIKASAAIGDMRKLNVACGRNLAHFLDRLREKIKAGIAIEADEEMVILASGDMQGDSEHSWVWLNEAKKAITPVETTFSTTSAPQSEAEGEGDKSKPNSPAAPFAHAPTINGVNDSTGCIHPAAPIMTALLTGKEEKDWGGWEHVETMVKELLEQQQLDQQLRRQQLQMQSPPTPSEAQQPRPSTAPYNLPPPTTLSPTHHHAKPHPAESPYSQQTPPPSATTPSSSTAPPMFPPSATATSDTKAQTNINRPAYSSYPPPPLTPQQPPPDSNNGPLFLRNPDAGYYNPPSYARSESNPSKRIQLAPLAGNNAATTAFEGRSATAPPVPTLGSDPRERDDGSEMRRKTPPGATAVGGPVGGGQSSAAQQAAQQSQGAARMSIANII